MEMTDIKYSRYEISLYSPTLFLTEVINFMKTPSSLTR